MNSAPLDKLHDFVQPPPPSWMPQTTGWYVLFALLAVGAALQFFKWLRSWHRNRYRRAALQELQFTPAASLSALLKRTALAVWPRQQVAALTGDAWVRFLNQSTDHPLFDSQPGSEIEDFALHEQPLNSSDKQALRHAAGEWIRRHRVST